MTTENNEQQPTTPAPPPATHVDVSFLSDRAMEALESHLIPADRDRIEKARIAGREAQRAEQARLKAEREASTKRAADAIQEVVDRDPEATEETKLPTPGWPAIELTVPPMLRADQLAEAEEYTRDMGEIAGEMGMPPEEAQTLLDFVISGATETIADPNTGNAEECRAHVRNLYGETSSEAIIQGAQAGFKKLPESVQAWLDTPNSEGQILGNHPAVLAMLSMWNSGYSRLTPDRAAAELAQHRTSELYFKGDRFTLDKVRLLSMIATRGQSNEMEVPVKPVAVGRLRCKLRSTQFGGNVSGCVNEEKAV